MLELRGVGKSFGATRALAAIDLQTEPSRTTVLIGPSGCGKSTVLRLMNGLLRPDEGTVRFEGEELTPANLQEARRRMGYVIQEGGLFPHLDCRGNVALLARHLRWPRDRIDARLAELCELTQFPTEGLARFPTQISGGQRQRVSLMRALMLDPNVLLLDEPLGSLDPMIRSELQTDLKRIFQSLGKTVVMVTHDMGEAAFFGDTIILLKDGRIIQQGPYDALLAAPADSFVTDFINAQRSPLDVGGGGAG